MLECCCLVGEFTFELWLAGILWYGHTVRIRKRFFYSISLFDDVHKLLMEDKDGKRSVILKWL